MVAFKLSKKPYIIKKTNEAYFIYKPDGYTSDHSYAVIQDTKLKSIINYVRNELNIDQNLKNAKYRYGQINRLDYGTNGTIIIAKNIPAFESIQKNLQDKKTKKVYIALVEDKLEKEHDFIMIYMKKTYENGNYRIEYSNDTGEPTLSEYYLWKHLYDESSKKYYSLVFIRIYTGMTHQIRVHMKSIGHPLINDFHYGNMDKTINDGIIFLLSYLYCIKGIGCSIKYKKEPEISFENLVQVYEKKYLEIITFLIKKNDERTRELKKFKKIVRKIGKRLTYYVIKKNQYTLVNIPSGKVNQLDAEVRDKLTCLIDNKLHIVGLIDAQVNYEYIYYFLLRGKVKAIDNDMYTVTPHKYIELLYKDRKYLFSQVFVKLKKNFGSFDELVESLARYNMIFIYDKKRGKNEVEYEVFKHFHNYVLPVVDGQIIKKFWIDNLEKNKYKYDNNLSFMRA